MLDSGQDQDWFSSREIIAEAVLASLEFYLFLVHVVSVPHPLIRPALFKDDQFRAPVSSQVFMVGIFAVSSHLALMTPWLPGVGGHYPVETADLIAGARNGFGGLVTTMPAPDDWRTVSTRLLVGIGGLVLLSYAYWLMTHWTPDVSGQRRDHHCHRHPGRRDGAVISPRSRRCSRVRHAGTVDADRGRRAIRSAAQSRRGHRRLRRDDESGARRQALHEMIGAAVNPFNRALQATGPIHQWLDPASRHGAAMCGSGSSTSRRRSSPMPTTTCCCEVMATVPAWLLLLMMPATKVLHVAAE